MRIVYLLLSIFLLAGCSQYEKAHTQPKKGLEVTVESKPRNVKLNETVKIKAKVEYGGKRLDDKEAEVSFEILENGISIGNVTPDYIGKGLYGIETMFVEPGTHQVIAHVNYREFHQMPKIEFLLN